MHSLSTMSDYFTALHIARNKGILAIAQTGTEPILCLMEWDCSCAPLTTNWKMLEAIGINPAKSSLHEIVAGLAVWNIYLSGWGDMTDSEILERLIKSILIEEVRLVPPTEDMSEFIDLQQGDPAPKMTEDGDPIDEEPRFATPSTWRSPFMGKKSLDEEGKLNINEQVEPYSSRFALNAN